MSDYKLEDLLANIRTHIPDFYMATEIMKRLRTSQAQDNSDARPPYEWYDKQIKKLLDKVTKLNNENTKLLKAQAQGVDVDKPYTERMMVVRMLAVMSGCPYGVGKDDQEDIKAMVNECAKQLPSDMSETQKALPEQYWGEWYNPKEEAMVNIKDHSSSKAYDDVIQELMDALKEDDRAAYERNEFEYLRAFKKAKLKGKLKIN